MTSFLNRNAGLDFDKNSILYVTSSDTPTREDEEEFYFVLPIFIGNTELLNDITHAELICQNNEKFKENFSSIFDLNNTPNYKKFNDSSNKIKQAIGKDLRKNTFLNYQKSSESSTFNNIFTTRFSINNKDRYDSVILNNNLDISITQSTFYIVLSKAFSSRILSDELNKIRITLLNNRNIVDYTDVFFSIDFSKIVKENRVANAALFYEDSFRRSLEPIIVFENDISDTAPNNTQPSLKIKNQFPGVFEQDDFDLLGLSRFEVVFNYDDRYEIIYSNSVKELLEYNPNYTSFTGTISIDSSNNTSFENSSVNENKNFIFAMFIDFISLRREKNISVTFLFYNDENNLVFDEEKFVYSVPVTSRTINGLSNNNSFLSRFTNEAKRSLFGQSISDDSDAIFRVFPEIANQISGFNTQQSFKLDYLNVEDSQSSNIFSFDKSDITKLIKIKKIEIESNNINNRIITNEVQKIYLSEIFNPSNQIQFEQKSLFELSREEDSFTFWFDKNSLERNLNLISLSTSRSSKKLRITFSFNILLNEFEFFIRSNDDIIESSSFLSYGYNSSFNTLNQKFQQNLRIDVLNQEDDSLNFSNISLVDTEDFESLSTKYGYFTASENTSPDVENFLKNCIINIDIFCGDNRNKSNLKFIKDVFDFSNIENNFISVKENMKILFVPDSTSLNIDFFKLEIKILPIPFNILRSYNIPFNETSIYGVKNVILNFDNTSFSETDKAIIRRDFYNFLFENTSNSQSFEIINNIKKSIIDKEELNSNNYLNYFNAFKSLISDRSFVKTTFTF